MPRLVAMVLLLAAALPLAGCIFVAPNPYPPHDSRWCYYHPGRCP